VHDLTGTGDAQRLLDEPPDVRPETAEVLPRLRRFDPRISGMLQEKDDSARTIPFKLVTADHVWSPELVDGFVAISYSWHSNDWVIPNRFNGDRN
jgi:hypothetical protein